MAQPLGTPQQQQQPWMTGPINEEPERDLGRPVAYGTYPLDNRAQFYDDDDEDDDAFATGPRGGGAPPFRRAPPPPMMPIGGAYDYDRGYAAPPAPNNAYGGGAYGDDRLPGRGPYQTNRPPSESSV